jgi:hypothetical protein
MTLDQLWSLSGWIQLSVFCIAIVPAGPGWRSIWLKNSGLYWQIASFCPW